MLLPNISHLFKGKNIIIQVNIGGVGFPQEAGTFTDACSGPAGFLVSLFLGRGGPAKAVETIHVPPSTADTGPWCCQFSHPSSS